MFAAAAPWPRGLERYRPAVRIGSSVAGAVLVAFHGWLLAGQFVDGRLAEPWVLLRWALAAALVAGLVALRRSGASVWGRKGVAIWVLAALLHGPAVATNLSNGPAFPEAVATLVIQIAATSGTLAIGLWMFSRLAAASDRRSLSRLAPVSFAPRLFPASYCPPFSPRPPPHA